MHNIATFFVTVQHQCYAAMYTNVCLCFRCRLPGQQCLQNVGANCMGTSSRRKRDERLLTGTCVFTVFTLHIKVIEMNGKWCKS